jgi:hypothetical protein
MSKPAALALTWFVVKKIGEVRFFSSLGPGERHSGTGHVCPIYEVLIVRHVDAQRALGRDLNWPDRDQKAKANNVAPMEIMG